MCRFQGSFSKTKPCGTSATTRRCSMRCCWTEPAFPGRTATSSRNGTIRLYFTLEQAQTKTPPQPPERHADLPGTGVQRLDYHEKSRGLGKPAPHHAELPVRCKAHRKGGRRCTSLTPSSTCRTARLFRLTPGQLRSVRGLTKTLLQLLGWRLPAAGRRLPAAHLPQPDSAGGSAAPCCPSSQSWNRPSSARRSCARCEVLRHGHPRPLRQGKILPRPAPRRFTASRRRNPPANGGPV